MKKTKKFLSILLATILILSLFPVTLAHASDNTITFSAEADKVDAKAGDIVNVDVCMSENSIVAALTLIVNYDNTALKILNVQSKEAFGYEEFNTAYGNNQFAYLTASANPKTVSGTLFTVQFEVLKDGCTEISLSVNELTDIDLQPIPSATQSAKIHNFVDGTCAECGEKSVKWKFDEETGTLTIFGTGPMDDYDLNNRPWVSFRYNIENVVITEGVITIGNYAFAECASLKSVTIPDSVVSIGANAFSTCISLPSITIPDSVTTIGMNAFDECHSLASVKIPDSVKTIGNYAFDDCGELVSVIIGNGVTIIGDYAFDSCYNLTNVTIGNSVTTIGYGAFWYCTSLVNIIIPDSVTSIGVHAFERCIELTSVTIGDSVAQIDNSAFYDCDSLTDVYYSNTEEKWYDISIDSDNDPLLNARIHYNSTGADTHPFNPVITPPTCTEQGYTTYVCACGYSNGVVENYVDANGHNYNSVVTPPTCTETGYTTYTCTVCGDTYVDDETQATGHSYKEEITTPATHTENGVMTYTCHCGDTYTEIINATGDHYYVLTVTEPTCTEGGYTTYTCACGDTYVDDETPANGHDYDAVVTEPTCTETGYTTYTCTVCDDTYVDGETSANGHSFSNGNCTVCGETDPDYYVFSVKAPSRTKIRNKDGIILHTDITGNAPADSYVEWTSNNNNFGKTVMNDGKSLQVIANNKGNTSFTATLYDANGNELATDSVELYSDSGFFQKIGGFFRSLFGAIKIYEN
ncbi:MAG: leucine-rich repeat protein [Clostridia bacterium]|nr:leucine-rich repeat protein [Clostridia bacterium]